MEILEALDTMLVLALQKSNGNPIDCLTFYFSGWPGKICNLWT